MNTQSRARTHWINLVCATLVMTLLISGFVMVSPVYADEGTDPDTGKPGDRIDERLEACLEKLNEWYDIQDANIGRANKAIQRIETLITNASELGIDTSEIEARMPSLYAAVNQAEAYHARANEILSEHAGFNGGGKVKDRQQALETCKSARDALASARDALIEARDIVREIIEIAKDLRQNYIPSTDAVS